MGFFKRWSTWHTFFKRGGQLAFYFLRGGQLGFSKFGRGQSRDLRQYRRRWSSRGQSLVKPWSSCGRGQLVNRGQSRP